MSRVRPGELQRSSASAEAGAIAHSPKPTRASAHPDRYDLRARRIPRHAEVQPRCEAPKPPAEHLVALDAAIQATLARGEPYRLQLADLVEKNLGPSATAVGKRLARKWIDNAAHHVFTDPHRWIVELVANAIDASRGTKVSAGQFGMGFLSCLEFLGHAETHGTRITVDTSTLHDAHRVTLSGKAADPEVCIEASPRAKHTGTTIRITPNVGRFSATTVAELTRQLALLQFNPHAGQARVSVTSTGITIADSGPGMSSAVIATKLLMPSGSTKTRAAADTAAAVVAPELVTWAGKRAPGLSYALIEIAGVVVVANEINPPARNARGEVTDVLLRMPPWTRVTLDRDEVILDGHGASAEEQYLRGVIDATVEQACAIGGPVSAAKLTALHTALRAWEDTSASSYLAGRPLTRYMKGQIATLLAADDRLVPVPGEDHASFAQVVQGCTHTYRFLPLPGELVDFDYRRAEQHIAPLFPPTTPLARMAFERRLIDGKTVVFVDPALLPTTRRGTPRITSFGLRDTLFVPSSYLRGADEATLRRRIIHTYAAGFAQLTAAKEPGPGGEAASLVERMTLVTNAQGRSIDEFDYYFDRVAHPWRPTYASVTAASTRKVFPAEHARALRDFWPMYRDHLLRHHQMQLQDANEHIPLEPLSDCISGALYETMYDASTSELCAEKLLLHGEACREKLRERLKDVGAVVPHHDGPVEVDVDALWRTLEPLLHEAHGVDWSNVPEGIWPFFDALTERLVRDNGHLFRAHDPTPVMQHHFQTLFERHRLPEDALVRLGSDVVWPLPANATADDVAVLFATLVVGLRDKGRDVQLDRRPDHTLCLPGMERVARVGELCALPLTVPHIVSPYAATLAPQRMAVLAPLASAQSGLQQSVRDLDVLRHSAGSLGLVHDVVTDERCSDALRLHLARIEQALLHLAVKQVDLADGAIAGGYDAGRVRAIRPALADPTSIRGLLTTWPGDDASLAKLVDLQRDHAAAILDPQLRTSTLVNGIFPSYRLDATFTPWASLARLRDAGIHDDHLLLLVDACRNPAELIYAGAVLLEVGAKLDASPSARSVVKAFIERLLQQRLDPHRLRAHTLELTTNQDLSPREGYHAIKKAREHVAIADFAKELAAQVEGVSRIPARDRFLPYGIAAAIAHAKPFSLSQLIAAQASNAAMADAVGRGDLTAAIKCARDASPGLAISKLSNNAEHGSERTPMQSALVETVQNAFDAVRTVQKEQAQNEQIPARPHGVAVSVDMVNAGERASLALTVYDSAGMPSLSTLLTDFILPDYSMKADTPGTVGVMGNGLFQLYADAAEVAMVTRLTSDPSKAYVLLATPRRENGRIVDLELRCADVSAQVARGHDFGSTLYIRMQSQARDAALYDAIYAQHFTRETLGAAHVRGSDGATIPLHLNEADTDMALKTLSPLAMRAAPTTSASAAFAGPRVNVTADAALVTHALPDGSALRILAREPATRVSQLTTGGVPVMDLARFCRQELLLPDNFVQFIDVGLVVDLPLGSYTPVQSRTDLKLPDATREALRTALLDAVWLRVFENATELDQIFQHFASDTSFLRQVAITPRAVRPDVDAAIANRQAMNLLAFMTHHEGIVTQSFARLVAGLLEQTAEVDAVLCELSEAYWRVGAEMGEKIHAWTIETRIAALLEQARTTTEQARTSAIAALKSAMSDMDGPTRALAERGAIPWLDKKLDQAVRRLLRTFDQQVESLRFAYLLGRPATTDTITPEELAVRRAAYAEKQRLVLEHLSGYVQALTAAHGSKRPGPSLGLDAPPFAEGTFDRKANHVDLSARTYGVFALAADLDRLATTGVIQPASTLAKLILASPTSAGTLNHEVHHWRQGDGDAHAPGVTPDGELVDFESCATAHHRAFVAEGGLLAWVERLRA